jgi:hypothetical protein
MQFEHNAKQGDFNRRIGGWKDGFERDLADIRVAIAMSRDHTDEIASIFAEHREASRAYMEQNTEALKGIVTEMKSTRAQNEAQHQEMMTIVMHGSSVAGRAVDQAHLAATKAETATTNLSKMTRATMVLVIAAAAVVAWVVSKYGIAWVGSIFKTGATP